jgi:hypothetical protein
MKKVFSTTVLAVFSFFLCFSQDVITKKTGEDIQAKILEVGQTDIKYKKTDNLEGPSFTITKSEVLMVRYSNGTKDIFGQEKTSTSDAKITSDDMCDEGKQDSKVNYKGKNSGAGWTCATTILFSPLIGLIPAVACSSSEPNDSNLNYKDSKSMKNNTYNQCYTEQAHKTKKRKIWRNFGIGAGVWLIIVILGSSGG